MNNINVYTGEEKSEFQPTLFEFYTDEELEISSAEVEEASKPDNNFD